MPPSWAAVVSNGGLGCAEVGNRQLRFLTAEDVNVPAGRTRLATHGTISALADHRMQGMFSQPVGRRVAIVVASLVVLGVRGLSAYQETVVANGGRIVGTVRVAGDITPLPPQ